MLVKWASFLSEVSNILWSIGVSVGPLLSDSSAMMVLEKSLLILTERLHSL